jgi:hypothetical protein
LLLEIFRTSSGKLLAHVHTVHGKQGEYMRINQQNSLPKIQESPENFNSNQSAKSNLIPPQKDLFEHAKTNINSLFSSDNDSLGNQMTEEIRNKKQMEQTSFKEFDEKTNETYNTLSSLLRALSEMRSSTKIF